mgnify:FL=1
MQMYSSVVNSESCLRKMVVQTSFCKPASGLPAGHTAFSWSAPVVASEGIIKLAASGNAAASRTAAAAADSVPCGHSSFSWNFGSASGAAAPAELAAAVEQLESTAAQVQTNSSSKTENHLRVEAALVLQGTLGYGSLQLDSGT